MPAWVTEGFDEYSKRLPRDMPLKLTEIPLGKRTKKAASRLAIESEAERILNTIGEGDTVIALEVDGLNWSTEKLAKNVSQWRLQGNNVVFLIGGPDGLSRECVARATQKWSLSALTLPHHLVRIVVAEQLYRAWSLLNNHPYHRA